jgi:hypothetical protein
MDGTERLRCECRKIAMIYSGFFGQESIRRNFVRTADMPLPLADRPDAARLDSTVWARWLAWRNVKNEG